MAAAANAALRQYGGALGPAVLGVILTSRIVGGAGMSSAVHTAHTALASPPSSAQSRRIHRLPAGI